MSRIFEIRVDDDMESQPKTPSPKTTYEAFRTAGDLSGVAEAFYSAAGKDEPPKQTTRPSMLIGLQPMQQAFHWMQLFAPFKCSSRPSPPGSVK